MTLGYSNSAYVVGTGRCGTHLLARLMAEEPWVHSLHECNPVNESFHRYCQWNELEVDHRGFLEIKKREIERASVDNRLVFEASAYLSLSVTTLYRAFHSKFLLMTRNPVDTVNSLYVKGWYRAGYHADNPDLAVGYHDLGRAQHFFGRLVPRGAELDDWCRLSRVGRIAWYWNMMHLRILEQFHQVPEENRVVIKLEELTHRKYLQLIRFLQIESQLSARRFEEISAESPGAGWAKKSRDSWSRVDLADFSRQVAPAAELLGYDLPDKGLMGSSALPPAQSDSQVGRIEDEPIDPCSPTDEDPRRPPQRRLSPRSILLAVRSVARSQQDLAWAYLQGVSGICVCFNDQGTIADAMPVLDEREGIVVRERILLFDASKPPPGAGFPPTIGSCFDSSLVPRADQSGFHPPIEATPFDSMGRQAKRDIDYLVVDEDQLEDLTAQWRPTAWDGCRVLLRLRSCLGLLKWREALACCAGVVISVDDLLPSMTKGDLLRWVWYHRDDAFQQNKCLVVELGLRASTAASDREAYGIAEWALHLGVGVLFRIPDNSSFWRKTLTEIIEIRDGLDSRGVSKEEPRWVHVGRNDTTSYS